jgi:hypothetical protein
MIRHCFLEGGVERVVYEVGAVRRMALYLSWLESSIKRVAAGTWSPLDCDKRGCRLTPEAKAFWHALRNVDDAPRDLCDGRRLNPWLRVGLHVARKWEPRLRWFVGREGVLSVTEDYPRRAMVRIVKFIRRVCNSESFKAWVSQDGRNAKENYKRCCEYLLGILRAHGRPLVLRIDLYFEGDAKSVSDSPEARQAYDKFMRNLSGSNIVRDVIGYIGKEEDGLDRRVHYHVMCLVDGNLHQQAYNLTEQLGRFWVNDCVGSSMLASYKNCYERKDEYRFNCLGLLHYANDRMLMGLREALEYMCKEEAYTLRRKDKSKRLRKGQAPKLVQGENRRGAPRKHGNDLSLAELILFTEGRH